MFALGKMKTQQKTHPLQSMLLLGIASSNGNGAEQAEAHAGLVHGMMPWRSADAKTCWHILGEQPLGLASCCCLYAGIYQAECSTCSLTSTSLMQGCCDS